MKACKCGAYGEGAVHTWACRDGRTVTRNLRVRPVVPKYLSDDIWIPGALQQLYIVSGRAGANGALHGHNKMEVAA